MNLKVGQTVMITYRGKLTEEKADIRGLRCKLLGTDERGLDVQFFDKNTGQPTNRYAYFLWHNVIMVTYDEEPE